VAPQSFSEITPEVTPEVGSENLDPAGKVAPESTPEVTPEVQLLKAMDGEMSRQALQEAMGLKDDEHFRKAYLLPALNDRLIEMTIPEKPRSSKQRYRMTPLGSRILAQVMRR